MFRVRGLELLFNLQKKNFKSKEDCLITTLHNFFINENLLCAGTGDVWPDSSVKGSELLPEDWNANQDVYSLRYINKDNTSRFLLKATKVDHILQVNVAMNENTVASMNIPVENYISDDYTTEYSNAYKNLESFAESFRENIMQSLHVKSESSSQKNTTFKPSVSKSPSNQYLLPPRPKANLERDKEPNPSRFPQIGGNDLDPLGSGRGGGMLLDPPNMGIPSRPTLPQFGVGGPGGLPRQAVPPGARFDPFAPPIIPSRPDPDHMKKPPDNTDN